MCIRDSFLAIVAGFPSSLGNITGTSIQLGGTTLLIVVGVALETGRSLEGYMTCLLYTSLKDLKAELFNLRFQHAINQLDNPIRIEAVKKDIARVMTVLAEKNAKNA